MITSITTYEWLTAVTTVVDVVPWWILASVVKLLMIERKPYYNLCDVTTHRLIYPKNG